MRCNDAARVTGWSRCASAAAWEPPEFSKGFEMAKELTTFKRGGSFLIEETAGEDIFTPEDFSEEQTMIRDMTEQFVEDEVLPQVEKIEHQQWDVTVALLRRCGELGLLGIEVPEKYGGGKPDKGSAMIVGVKIVPAASFV